MLGISGWAPLVGSCEHGDGTLVFQKNEVNFLSDWRLVKKDAASWS
jgi:hypothetical protein